jgi:hypothetical protein
MFSAANASACGINHYPVDYECFDPITKTTDVKMICVDSNKLVQFNQWLNEQIAQRKPIICGVTTLPEFILNAPSEGIGPGELPPLFLDGDWLTYLPDFMAGIDHLRQEHPQLAAASLARFTARLPIEKIEAVHLARLDQLRREITARLDLRTIPPTREIR